MKIGSRNLDKNAMTKEFLYSKIVNQIKNKIESGEYAIDSILPSENVLCELHNTTRMTVRKSMQKLINDGYIYSLSGKGYYVKKREMNKYLISYDEKYPFQEEVNEISLLSVDIIRPTIELVYKLQIQERKRVVEIKRLFQNDSGVFAYDEKYIPYFRAIPIVEHEINFMSFPELISSSTSLYNITTNLSISLIAGHEYITEYLNLPAGSPLILVDQVLSDDSGQPTGWGKTYYRMDKFKLRAKLAE